MQNISTRAKSMSGREVTHSAVVLSVIPSARKVFSTLMAKTDLGKLSKSFISQRGPKAEFRFSYLNSRNHLSFC